MNDEFSEFDLSESDERLLDQFEAEFSRFACSIEEFLSQLSHSQTNAFVLLELALLEMELRYKAGDFVQAEEYFTRFPTLASSPELMVRLIVDEFRLMQGQVGPKIEGYLQRFPRLRMALLAALHDLKGQFSFARPLQPPSSQPEWLGHYEIIEQVGQGACGIVYKAKDQLLGRIVAVKKLRTDEQQSPQFSAVLNEARNAAVLTHPHIVPLFEVTITDHHDCLIVYQFIEGSDLAGIIRQTVISCKEAAAWLLTIAKALQSAHDLGILHLDIKPSNILLDEQRKVWLSDFGLSRCRQEVQRLADSLPEGTLAYMSPEQAGVQSEPIDERSDVYSLGVVLFELLTGHLPFQGNRLSLLEQLRSAVAPPSPRMFRKEIDRDLEQICLKALDRCPAQRYQSAREMAEDLQQYLAGKPTQARPLSKAARTARWCWRNPERTTLALIAVVACLVGVTGFGLQRRKALQQERIAEKGAASLFNTLSTIVQISSEAALRDPKSRDQMQAMLTVAKDNYEQSLLSDPVIRSKPKYSARAFQGLGTVFNQLGDYHRAVQAFDEAQRCLKDHETTDDYRALSIEISLGKATSYRRSGDKQSALPLYYGALGEINSIASSDADCMKRTAEIAWYIAEAELSLKKLEVARKMASLAYDQWSECQATHFPKGDTDCVIGKGKSKYLMATCDLELGRFANAADGFQNATEHFEALTSQFSNAINFKRDLAASYHNQARALKQLGNNESSVERYRRAIEIRRSLANSANDNQLFANDLLGSVSSLNQLKNQ